MTPSTRTSKRDADFKVYYSKKVPQQVRFPHKRKVVRRPDPAQDGADMKQMKFSPEKMKRQTIDAEDCLEESMSIDERSVQGVAHQDASKTTPTMQRRGKKRQSIHLISAAEDTEEELESSSPKRRKRNTAPIAKRSPKTHYAGSNADVTEQPRRLFRRQSTMTQLADGRRPLTGVDEPDLKSVKRRSRTSWGGVGVDKERDKRQRTLTQMIPGIDRLSREELDELSDLDADLECDKTNNSRVLRSLAEQGLLATSDDLHETTSLQPSVPTEVCFHKSQDGGKEDLSPTLYNQRPVVAQSVEDLAEGDARDYNPLQFIESPFRGIRRTPLKMVAKELPNRSAEVDKSGKSRFSLLATPERRRVLEIPSSQSPTDTVLSTQTSLQKSNRATLADRNDDLIIAETPTKPRRVIFQKIDIRPATPAQLRKFESTIQDSEDDYESNLEDDINEGEERTQSIQGQAVGTDTQAVLNQIDEVCADTNEQLIANCPEGSEEPEEPVIRRAAYQPSPELGESWAPVIYDDDGPDFESYRSMRLGTQSLSLRNTSFISKESLSIPKQANDVDEVEAVNDDNSTMPTEDIPSTPPTMQQSDAGLPSTPMVIKDESSDDELRPAQTPARTVQRIVIQRSSNLAQHTADLDGEPVQISRSLSVDGETQHSHSSKAEQQLQSEWFSYSQYIRATTPNTSSMRAGPDAFSYNSTPRLSRTDAVPASSARFQHSQATTVDELTPKKHKTQCFNQGNTTPHKTSRSQPYSSPDKPPSLFIPSSFPSPSRATMEGWSSPTTRRTQNLYGNSQILDSLENFSIPLPPPIEYD